MAELNLEELWKLFHDSFKEGDDVIIITDNDKYNWGELKLVGDEGIILKKTETKEDYVNWKDVRFIAHDGFPIHKLTGADGHYSIEKIDTEDLQETIRRLLSSERFVKYKVFSDPYLIENVNSKIVNIGVTNPKSNYQETVIMKSLDGAVAHLWDIDSIYFFGAKTQ